MSRRIDVELTSTREDGSWTWRAAGAKQPKGVVDGGLVPAGTSVGDVLRADVEMGLDHTEVTALLPPKGKKPEPERIELLPRGGNEELVTTTLVGRRDRGDRRDRADRRDRGDRGPRGDRPGGGRGGPGGRGRDDRGGRPSGERGDRDRGRGDRPGGGRGGPGGDRPGGDRPRRPPRERTAPPARPKAKRLRAGRAHRKAVLDALPPEEQVIAEQVLRGGVPAVRQAVEKQNEQAKVEGRPEVKPEPLLAIAERLLPRLRVAEWHDRAEAALADIDELDLRDLRSVVVAADGAAKDDETRALAAQLREGLARRVDEEQANWIADLTAALGDGRTVRALRLSSRPPKAGSPLPPELATKLTDAASAALTDDITPDRWAMVLDALSYAPIRQNVTPASIPDPKPDELLAAVKRVSSRLPQIAALFGIEPSAGRSRGGKGGAKPKGAKPVPPPPPKADAPSADAPTDEVGEPIAEPEVTAGGEPEAQEAPALAEAPPGTPPGEPEIPAVAPVDGPAVEEPVAAPPADTEAPAEPASAPASADEPGEPEVEAASEALAEEDDVVAPTTDPGEAPETLMPAAPADQASGVPDVEAPEPPADTEPEPEPEPEG